MVKSLSQKHEVQILSRHLEGQAQGYKPVILERYGQENAEPGGLAAQRATDSVRDSISKNQMKSNPRQPVPASAQHTHACTCRCMCTQTNIYTHMYYILTFQNKMKLSNSSETNNKYNKPFPCRISFHPFAWHFCSQFNQGWDSYQKRCKSSFFF